MKSVPRDPRSGRDRGDPQAADLAFARQLRDALRDSETLDYVTRARLGAARARAVAEARKPRGLGATHWLGLGGALAAGLLVAVLAPWRAGVPVPVAPTSIAHGDTLELLLDENDPEFYEDLDLYRWIEGQGGVSA